MDGPLRPQELETARLRLQRLTLDDAPFILELVTQPSWLRFIGDKNVHSLADAHRYLREGPLALYARHGFGPYRVTVKAGGEPAGICGLIKRDALADPDIGFALLPRFWSKGYAREAAAAVIGHAREVLRLPRVLAITSLDNVASGQLLEHVGFHYQSNLHLDPGGEVRLFSTRWEAPVA